MEINEGIRLEGRVRLIQSKLWPIYPSDLLLDIGKYIQDTAKCMINIRAENERFVSIGYYIKDISPHISTVRADIVDNRELPNKKAEVLFFNLLFYELLSDLAVFQTRQDKKTCMYVISKYSRYFASFLNNHVAADFYNWLYHLNKKADTVESNTTIALPSAGSVVVLLHEWLHKQPAIHYEAAKMLFDSKGFVNNCTNLSKKEVEEVCCDITAILMFLLYDYNKPFGLSTTEIVGISMLALYVDSIYSFIKEVFLDGMNSQPDNAEIRAKKLFATQEKRFKAASVGMACNFALFPKDCDLTSATRYASSVCESFLRHTAELFINDYLPLINRYNSLSDIEREGCSFNISCQEWGMFV